MQSRDSPQTLNEANSVYGKSVYFGHSKNKPLLNSHII